MVFSISAGEAAAQDIPFDVAIGLARRSPAVRSIGAELRAREAGDEGIGGTAQATTIQVQPGALVVPESAQGFEGQINITQGWNLSDLGARRREAASAEREAIAARRRLVALRGRSEAARLWIALATAEALVDIARTRRQNAAERVERSERALELGARTRVEVIADRAELSDAHQRLLQAEGEQHELSLRLARTMGRSPSAELRAVGALPNPSLPNSFSIDRAGHLPAFRMRALEAEAARLRQSEAEGEQAPIFSLGAQLERDAAGAWVLFGIASLQLQLFGAERRATSLARAQAAAAQSQQEEARLSGLTELSLAEHEVHHADQRLTVLRDELLPAVLEELALRERERELGEGSAFDVYEARDRLDAARAAEHRLLGARSWATVRLWLLLAATREPN